MTRELAIECIKTQRQFVDDMTKEAIDMAIEALKAQDVTDTNVGGMVYKQAAIDAVAEGLKSVFVEYRDVAEKMISKLPSAQPDLSEYSDKLWRTAFERGKAEGKEERKTGRWLKISPAGIYECSECGKNVMTADIEAYEFCHGCGCRMMEVEHERR